MDKFVSLINDIVWSPALVVLLVGAGLYFSIRTRFVQVRKLGLMVKSLFAPAQKDKDGRAKGISSFQPFSVALSGRVGTGNIVGVATAIVMGGPACYIEKGLKCKWLAVLFAVLTLLGYGLLLGTVVASKVAGILNQ